MAAFVHPKVTLRSWQDVKIQLLMNELENHSGKTVPVDVAFLR